MAFRSGFVTVVGRPNVGKSTLVNALVGQKVSIVTDRPQTTRARIHGVRTTEEHQLVFTDTPGFHKPRTALGRRLNRMVEEGVAEADAIMLVVDAHAGVGRGDEFVARTQVAPRRGLKVCAVNKIDRVGDGELIRQLEAAARLAEFGHVVPVSARTGKNLEELLAVLEGAATEGPAFFPPGQVTDQPLEFRIAEVVREKALAATREEVPHSIAVQVEELDRDEDRDLVRIHAVVLVERDSQKGIVIGKGGQMLKRIGSLARKELEGLLGARVYLELRVKVQREWQRDPAALTRLGY
ncbi:MAG: GTPase Era [Actinomycetota bacterium]